jgi:hypothetical protein
MGWGGVSIGGDTGVIAGSWGFQEDFYPQMTQIKADEKDWCGGIGHDWVPCGFT